VEVLKVGKDAGGESGDRCLGGQELESQLQSQLRNCFRFAMKSTAKGLSFVFFNQILFFLGKFFPFFQPRNIEM